MENPSRVLVDDWSTRSSSTGAGNATRQPCFQNSQLRRRLHQSVLCLDAKLHAGLLGSAAVQFENHASMLQTGYQELQQD